MFLITIPWIASALTTTTAAVVATTTTNAVTEAFVAGTVVCATAAKGIDSCQEK